MERHVADGLPDLPGEDAIGPRALGILTALQHAGISVMLQDRSLKVLWAHHLPGSFGDPDQVGVSEADVIPGEEGRRMAALKSAVIETGQPEHTETSHAVGENVSWYEVWIDPTRHDGAISGVMTTLAEISERKRREQTLRTLLREVSHRSRNLLAIVQSIASQTGRYSDSIERFLYRFRGRIQSMSSSQDIITSSNWRGAMLKELIDGQLVKYQDAPARGVAFEGSDVELFPNAALHVGLALHELIVNSVSFGALSQPGGSVRLLSEPKGDRLRLEWIETTQANEDFADSARFGSVALRRVVPSALDGEAEYYFDDHMLHYVLLMPDSNFRLQRET
jgi:two-component sensor histidine kinase